MICTAYFWLDGGRLNPTQFKRQSHECFAIFLKHTPARPLTNSLEKLFFFLLLFSNSIKGIVSRDWEGLQMIWLQRWEVFNISAECFCLFLSSISYRIFKNGHLNGASFQHSLSKDQYSSGDLNSLADSQKVMQRMLPGDPRQAN